MTLILLKGADKQNHRIHLFKLFFKEKVNYQLRGDMFLMFLNTKELYATSDAEIRDIW